MKVLIENKRLLDKVSNLLSFIDKKGDLITSNFYIQATQDNLIFKATTLNVGLSFKISSVFIEKTGELLVNGAELMKIIKVLKSTEKIQFETIDDELKITQNKTKFYIKISHGDFNNLFSTIQNKKKIDSLSSEKSKIKNEIGLQFVKISRPLNKYVYVSALDKPQKKLLAGLIDNPYDVLTETNKNDIAQILESVRKGIESGSVSVKDVSKSISQIDETLPKLDNFIKQIITYDKSKNDIEVKLSNFDDEQLRLEESNLARSQRDKLDAESKIKLLDSEITKTVESIPRYIKSIESILNQISAVQYKIKQSWICFQKRKSLSVKCH